MTAFELVVAFLCAALSGMGVGGGGLLLIYLTLVGEMEQRQAQLYNLIFFLAASAASLLIHALRRSIKPGVVLWLSLGGVIGALLGSFLSGVLGGDVLGIMLGAFLFISGASSFFELGKKGGGQRRRTPASRRKKLSSADLKK